MASKKLKGIVVEIGGDTTKLGKALEASSQKSVSLTRELKQVNGALKFNPDSVELLTQKQTILTERVEATSEQLKVLKDAQAQVQKQFERGDIGADQYREFQREILTTESRLDTFKGQLAECQTALSKLGSESSESSRDLDKLTSTISEQESKLAKLADEYTNIVLTQGKGSTEAKQLASQITSLNSELNDNKTKLNQAKSATDELTQSIGKVDNEAKSAEGGFTIFKGVVANLAATAITAAISKIGEFIGSLGELTEATEEYRQMQAKLEGSANSFGYSMDFVGAKYQQLYKYVGDDQMATNAITNLLGLGLETKNVQGLVDGAIATWSAYGDSIPIESLTESVAETINVSKVTGTLADAINWASLSNEKWSNILGKGSDAQKAYNAAIKDGQPIEDAFSAALAATTDEKERANLVSRLLNETYGESKKTYDENAKSILDAHEAELKLKDSQAQLAETISPVQNAFTNLKASLLEQVVPAFQAFADLLSGQISFDEFVTKIQNMIQQAINTIGQYAPMLISQGLALLTSLSEGFVQGFPDMLAKVLDLINQMGQWLAQNVPVFIQKGYEILSNLIQGITNALPVLISKVPQIVITFAQIINDNFPTILAKGFELLKQLLSGILSAIPTLVANIPQIIQAIISVIMAYNWLGLGGNIIKFFGNGISSMVGFVGSTATNIFNAVVNVIKNLPNTLWTWASNAVSNFANAIRGGSGSASGAIGNIFNAIVNGIKGLPSQMLSIGKNVVQGLWNGISNMAGWIQSKIQGFGKGVLNSLKSFFGIHSPSRLFRDEIGRYLAEGIGVGIADNADSPIAALEDLGDNMLDKAKGINGLTIEQQLKTTFSGDASGQPAGTISDLVSLVSEYFPKLIEASKKSIVLDSGVLVGETVTQMDERLALEYQLRARGV